MNNCIDDGSNLIYVSIVYCDYTLLRIEKINFTVLKKRIEFHDKIVLSLNVIGILLFTK